MSTQNAFPSHKAALVGLSGYVGAELAKLLLQHPALASLSFHHSGKQGDTRRVADLHPHLNQLIDAPVTAFDSGACAADIVFLATPHEASAKLLPALLAQGKTVFDLSGAFRLRDAAQAQNTYGLNTEQAALIADTVHGLPEFCAAQMYAARAISIPGCYPTAATLALKPLCDAGVLDKNNALIVNAVSGVSGAGKKPLAHTSFCEVSLTPYGLPTHRHTPEIEQNLQHQVVFTPHLGPWSRGLLASCYATLKAGVSAEHISAIYLQAYQAHPLVRVLTQGWPSINNVAQTAYADIAFDIDTRTKTLRAFCAIDNLMKGAASQALQMFNAQQGLPLNLGLIPAIESARRFS